VVDFLMIASADERVERVFVNPVIKKAACEAYKGEPWLGKLRPWWGHDDHCHVRLACPTGGSHCKPQEAAPAGDGCDASLEQWFTAETRAEARRKREHPQPSSLPSLPALCREVLNSD
jgi:penicillin-insensitive murein endopeptidase